jgi:hypothetical protein
MGTFHYGRTEEYIDDADLALLQEVVTIMLARPTPFLLTLDHDGDGREAFWIHPGAALRFHVDDADHVDHVDAMHLDLMTAYASSGEGVTIRLRQRA